MSHGVDAARDASPNARFAKSTLAGIAAGACAAFLVWFVGYDLYWASAALLCIGPITTALISLTFDEPPSWETPARDTPRGTRLVVANIEQSLAACDRLARSALVRRMRAMLTPERNDLLARAALLRQLRALLVAELRDHGIDPTTRPDDITRLLGTDALTILQPHAEAAITANAIASVLDAVDGLANTNALTR